MKTSKIIIAVMMGFFILMLIIGLLMLKSYLKSTPKANIGRKPISMYIHN